MYNKLFTKILDSSVWLEPSPTRIVWFTFLAAMDRDGIAHFASVANLAHRAVLTIEETEAAVRTLESPDTNSSDPENDGRRIERVPGGWAILNAGKYRAMATVENAREGTRKRVAAYRARKACNGYGNASVTPPSVYASDSASDSSTIAPANFRKPNKIISTETGPLKPEPLHPAHCNCTECRTTLREPAADYTVKTKGRKATKPVGKH